LRKYPAVDSAGEISAGIRGGVNAALWTRPVSQRRGGEVVTGSVGAERPTACDGGGAWR
jgi:hypothetical protein